jgi:hypothetical protein
MDYYELLWTYIDLYHFHFSRILPSPQRTHHDNPLLARCFFWDPTQEIFLDHRESALEALDKFLTKVDGSPHRHTRRVESVNESTQAGHNLPLKSS